MKTPFYVNFEIKTDSTEVEIERYLRYLRHFLNELYEVGILALKPSVDSFEKEVIAFGKKEFRVSVKFE